MSYQNELANIKWTSERMDYCVVVVFHCIIQNNNL